MSNSIPNIKSYEESYSNFSWDIPRTELGYSDGNTINIGEYCSDRICKLGYADKLALIWEGFTGEVRKFTFNDMRVFANTIANFLKNLGLNPGDRVCLFMDKVSELYFGFLGILKMGGIAQPLFSAFGPESLFTRLDDAKTSAIITQKKHLHKVRATINDLPSLKHIIVVDDDGTKPLKEREIAFHMEKEERIEKFDSYPSKAETPSVLHYTSGTTGKPKGAQHVHYSIISQYISAKYALDLKEDDIYWCTADPGWKKDKFIIKVLFKHRIYIKARMKSAEETVLCKHRVYIVYDNCVGSGFSSFSKECNGCLNNDLFKPHLVDLFLP